jgi:aspartate/methionine/tyrosine aminotransferase
MFHNGNGGKPLCQNTQMFVTNGAIGGLFSTVMNFVGPGDEVLMFEPYYSQYVNHIEFAGATIKTAPMHVDEQGSWQFDWQKFEQSITAKTKLVQITNPHNPSGKMFSQEEIKTLTEILDRHPHVKVLSDDVYFFLPFGEPHVSFANYSPSNFAKTLTIFSSGKMLNCTGWKIGWAIGPSDLIKQAMYVHEATTFNCNVPGQIAVAKSLDKAYN